MLTYRKEPGDDYKTEYQLYVYLLDLIKLQVEFHESTVTGGESLGKKVNYEKSKKIHLNKVYPIYSKANCAIDYISHFDIITRDMLNIYNFLDFYGYHHNSYDEARALLYELCWFGLVG
ncbi:hypothetical protein ACGO3R_12635 [Lactococcus lactis]